MDLNTVSRRAVMGLFGNSTMTRLVTRFGMSLGADRFVAGEDVEAALETVRELNDENLLATLDHLGESVTDESLAREAAAVYVDLLDKVRESGVQSTVSLKPTQMGLAVDPSLAEENIRLILDRARETGNSACIDMEDSPTVDATLEIWERLVQDYGPDRVEMVLQAYLYRSMEDAERVAAGGARVRLCKGAYAEPASVAFPRKRDVDDNFLKLIKICLTRGSFTAIATHDERIIARAIDMIKKENIDPELYEFQMLYGIRPMLQRDLAREGYQVRIYVPYGREWYPFFVRRLAERPANVLFVLSNLLKR